MISVLIFLSHFSCSSSGANRQGDVIGKLFNANRIEEAEQKCQLWNAKGPETAPLLKENCAKIHRLEAEKKGSLEAWQSFRETWAGTAEAEATRDIHAELMLKNGIETEEYFLEAAEIAKSTKLKEKATELAIKSAISAVISDDEARELARKYPDSPHLIDLIARFPAAFFQISILGDEVTVDKIVDIAIDTPKVNWVAQWPDGTQRDWDTAVRLNLETMGISRSHVMRVIQDHKGKGPALPLCPMSNQPPGWVAGVSLRFKSKTIFKAAPWDDICSKVMPALLSYKRGKFIELSLGPTHHINLFGRPGNRKQITDFVRSNSTPLLFESKIYLPYRTSYLTLPIDGSPAYMSESPPGVWKIPLNKDLRGERLPKDWKLSLADQKLVVRAPNLNDWIMPNGEVRVISPMVKHVLGIQEVVPRQPDRIDIEWTIKKRGHEPPEGTEKIKARQLKPSEISNAGLQLSAAGFISREVEIYDGWVFDINGDDAPEAIIRAQLNGNEVVFILDRNHSDGPRTFVFGTQHAAHGNRPAPTPFAFNYGDLPIFAWSGTENGQNYIEWIHMDRDGFQVQKN